MILGVRPQVIQSDGIAIKLFEYILLRIWFQLVLGDCRRNELIVRPVRTDKVNQLNKLFIDEFPTESKMVEKSFEK